VAYRWELDGPARLDAESLPEHVRQELDRFMEAVAIVDPADLDAGHIFAHVSPQDAGYRNRVVDDISHEGLRILLRDEGVTFQRLKTWKASKDPQLAEKKARVEQLYAIADREVAPAEGDPEVVFCVDEFGPLNLQPPPGRQWAPVSGKKEPGRAPRRRMRATYTRTAGVRRLFAAYELGEDKLFGHIKPRKTRGRFLEFCRYLRSLYPSAIRIAIIWDNYSPHLTTARDGRVGACAKASNVEIAYTRRTCPG
jgi:hypothetical protein